MPFRKISASDIAFEEVYHDIKDHPASVIRDIAGRTGWSVATVTNVVILLREERAVIRRKNERKVNTYTVVPSPLDG